MSTTTEDNKDRRSIYALIDEERGRQHRKFPGRTIADALPLDTKLRILVEEVGEVAQAIDRYQSVKLDPALSELRAELRAELVQVAACAVGMLEAL